ncbi:MAG TPA: glycosyltransferase family 39 protein [Burkholderiaceae bacterium]|nr:glycosyltransferase family 39 protein [Burkholderiaceae bacterium]
MTSAAGPSRWLQLALAVVLVVRLVTLGTYPLADTSEARYGEIARVMRETGNWVTPQETPGTPFWAKPPLYAWLSAGSTYLFGVDEFALRLPSLLCGFGVLALCSVWAGALARRPSPPAPLPQAGEGSAGQAVLDRPSPTRWETGGGEGAGLLSCLILATSGFFIGYGAVMTDPALGLCTAWMLVAFQRAVIDRSDHAVWRYGLFVASGLAMLAKGPVAFLYVAMPVAAWATWRKRWPQVWQSLPWVAGIALAAAISLPWYAWAEVRTPGFLNYFLIGEHVLRYLEPGWTGDRYGTAHREPVGTIWAYLVAALGLWSMALLAMLRPARGWVARARAWCADDGRLFALLAVLLPMLVFTFASNEIWTYVLPVLTPLATLLGLQLAGRWAEPGPWRRGVIVTACASVAVVCLGALAWAPQRANGSSFAGPVAAWRAQLRTSPGELLYWGHRTPASLRFYTRGSVQAVPDLSQRLGGLAPGSRLYVAIVPEQLEALRQAASAQPQPLDLAVIGQVKHAAIVEVARKISVS